MNKIVKNNISLLNNITWYDINIKGYINKCLKNQSAVYIFMQMPCLNEKASYYVGSTIGLKKRLNSHKYRATCLESSIFYRSISKHGWPRFKFGILEYVDSSNIMNIEQRIKTLLSREQYYLDNINPSLNSRKKASSPLGKKRTIKFDSL